MNDFHIRCMLLDYYQLYQYYWRAYTEGKACTRCLPKAKDTYFMCVTTNYSKTSSLNKQLLFEICNEIWLACAPIKK